jgi:uncharacterized alkaline shock family protein YloU
VSSELAVRRRVAGLVRRKRGGIVAHAFGGAAPWRLDQADQGRPATREEDVARVTAEPIPGRSLVTKRAVRELVRTAVLSVYGVSGFASGRLARLFARGGLGSPGLRLAVEPAVAIDLDLLVAYGLPVAEVARQVESAVRYTLRYAIGREPEQVSIRIGSLRHEHGIAPLRESAGTVAPSPADLAASGTDVA